MAILLFSFVCLGTPFYPVQAAQKKPSNVFMWSVQGSKAKVFLLGSMHLFKAGSYPLDPRIEKAIDSGIMFTGRLSWQSNKRLPV